MQESHMSLAINPDKVTEVLLVDGWHKVKKGTFSVDAYEFIGPDNQIFMGGGVDKHVSSTGAQWNEGSVTVSCPMMTIHAVRHK